jgi:hypothetical protein
LNRLYARCVIVCLAILSSACAPSVRRPPAELPPLPRLPDTPTPSAGPWRFNHAAGTRAYRISRNASIEGTADSVSRREIVSNFTHETITLEPGEERTTFRAVVDSFAVLSEGLVGPPQQVVVPVELIGSIGNDGLRIEETSSGRCNAVTAIAVTDLHNLLTQFPSSLAKNTTWKDSVTTSGCYAGIQTTVATKRTFTVTGEIDFSGRRLLLIQRLDSISALGDGAYNQHRMKVESTGTGSARYYLDTGSGEVAQMTTSHLSRITVTTSGRMRSFTQTTNQDLVRVR